MPWTAKSYRERHNKKLSPEKAKKAAEMANAMVREGVDEGVAIATANKHASRAQRRYGKKK